MERVRQIRRATFLQSRPSLDRYLAVLVARDGDYDQTHLGRLRGDSLRHGVREVRKTCASITTTISVW